MRNLKRALSLTLASVMLLGMMVVGTSAAESYPDVSEKENIEAIEVLQEVGVMTGDNNGNFNPDDYVTREQMAVIMSQLLKLNYDYYEGTNPFSDVPAWAAKYVAACAANGITSGIGGGMYGAGQNVNAVQAALMMLKALGYFQYQEDFGDSYILATVKQATETGLFDMIDSRADQALTRNEVAQMALNALKSDMVSFTGDVGTKIPTSDGREIVVGYKAEYTPRTSTLTKYQAIEKRSSDVGGNNNLNRGQYYIQLGEELYDGDLRLNDNAVDDFGRPSRYWEYKGEAIGTYMKKELIKAEYTKGISGKDLYTLLGADTIKNYDFDITIDGVTVGEKTGVTENDKVLTENAASFFDETYMTKTYNSTIGKTGKGVLTQVFVNFDTEEVDIAVINTYLAKASADYSEKKDEAKLDVYSLTKTTGTADKDTVWYKFYDACKNNTEDKSSRSVSSEDFAIAADVKADDFFLVTVANGDIKSMVAPQVLANTTLNKFSKNSYVVSDGTQYDYNTTIEYDPDVLDLYTSENGNGQELKDTEYNLFLDAYGYLIGLEIVEKANNYIFLTGIDQGTSNLKNKTSEAAGILLDGTFVEFKMNMNDSRAWSHNHIFTDNLPNDVNGNHVDDKVTFSGHPLWNTWCTYTVDKDGVYTLTEVRDTIDVANGVKIAQTHDNNYADRTIDHNHVSLVGKGGAGAYAYVYGNDDTVYIVPELTRVASDTDIAANSVRVPDNTTAPSAILYAKNPVGIISGVDSVATGIDNVDLHTWTLAEIKAQDNGKLDISGSTGGVLPGNVYTLYNKDGYVIAAIVLGEDNGSSKNLVYSHKSSIESEEYSNADDEWTWTRKVISNGEEILLTQTGDKLKDNNIWGMTQNTWYEVTYKADGTVKNVKHAYFTESGQRIGATVAGTHSLELTTSTNKDDAEDFVNNIEYLSNATANSGKTTVLYEQVWNVAKAPSLQGNTLYVDTVAQKGFYVSKDVKSVLIQTNNSKGDTTYYEGSGQLAGILDDLNDLGSGYSFKISAVMTNGYATVVIIHDWNETQGQLGNKDKPVVGNHPAGILVDTTDKLDLKYYNANEVVSNDEAAQDITQWLVDEGWTILEGVDYDGTDYVWKATQNDGKTKYTFKWRASDVANHAKDIKVYVNGTPYAYKAADGTVNLLVLAGVETAERSSYIKKVNGSTVAFNTASGFGTGLVDGDQLTTGYLAVVDNTGTGADVSSLVDVSNLEAATGAASTAQHYALPGTSIVKASGENAAASGLAAGASGSLEYVPYSGGTYGQINEKDGTTNDWKAQISAIGKVKVTFVDHTINPTPATTTYVTAQAYGDLAAADHSSMKVNANALSTFGTHYYIDSVSGTAIANAATTNNALTDGCTVHIGYVETGAAVDTGVADTGKLEVTWSTGANAAAVVPVGTNITATITFTNFKADGADVTITASQANAITGVANVTAKEGTTLDTDTKWDGTAGTYVIKDGDEIASGTVTITFKVGATGGTTDATPKLAKT